MQSNANQYVPAGSVASIAFLVFPFRPFLSERSHAPRLKSPLLHSGRSFSAFPEASVSITASHIQPLLSCRRNTSPVRIIPFQSGLSKAFEFAARPFQAFPVQPFPSRPVLSVPKYPFTSHISGPANPDCSRPVRASPSVSHPANPKTAHCV